MGIYCSSRYIAHLGIPVRYIYYGGRGIQMRIEQRREGGSAQEQKCQIIPFPICRRAGKIRDVAVKMREKDTNRHAAYYQRQVTEGLRGHLIRVGVSQSERGQMINSFWREVRREMDQLNWWVGAPPEASQCRIERPSKWIVFGLLP